jgi:uncharacterized protein YrrD
MLRSIKYLEGDAVDATDGTIGHVRDFYFDDQCWVVRYLVVDTGVWLAGRKVLVSPRAVVHADWTLKEMHVALTQEQVKRSPDIDTERPVSRQHEMQHSDFYGYPYYWDDVGNSDGGMNRAAPADSSRGRTHDPQLRSCAVVVKYHVHASDGDVGHVEDLLVDDQTWAIRFLIVNTGDWWLGHKVLLAPQSIHDVSWLDSRVSVNSTRQAIKEAPAYDPTALEARAQLLRLHEHDGHATGDPTWIGAEQVRADEQLRDDEVDDDSDADQEDALISGKQT